MKKSVIIFILFCLSTKAQNYKTYIANLEQNFTNPPFSVTVIKNTLGGTPTFTRNFAGSYGFHLTGAFPIDRTVVFMQSTIYGWLGAYRLSDDEITIETREVALSINSIDNHLNATAFEIRVYDPQTNTAPSILDTTITITSAQILNIFSSPVTLIPTPGIGKTIELVSLTEKLNFNTTAYGGHKALMVITNTATSPQCVLSCLNQSANVKYLAPITGPNGATQILDNQSLIITADTGNPTTGNSTITLHIYYRILDY